jgi:hypothetical protein
VNVCRRQRHYHDDGYCKQFTLFHSENSLKNIHSLNKA